MFVDANVLLYAHGASEPAKQPRAKAWLERVWRDRVGRTSVQVLSEYYVNATRKLRPGPRPVSPDIEGAPLAPSAGNARRYFAAKQ